ncbi:hypothetical protein E2542_SST23880 [Spatholobus suberectus]|nr:hypothetical protein E2542_SST23880 [Spatholobus suberectus]
MHLYPHTDSKEFGHWIILVNIHVYPPSIYLPTLPTKKIFWSKPFGNPKFLQWGQVFSYGPQCYTRLKTNEMLQFQRPHKAVKLCSFCTTQQPVLLRIDYLVPLVNTKSVLSSWNKFISFREIW